MKELREKLKTEELKQNWLDSVERPTELLSTQMKRLNLKEKPFNTFKPADEETIDDLWQKCLEIDDQLQVGDLYAILKIMSLHDREKPAVQYVKLFLMIYYLYRETT